MTIFFFFYFQLCTKITKRVPTNGKNTKPSFDIRGNSREISFQISSADPILLFFKGLLRLTNQINDDIITISQFLNDERMLLL